MTHRTLKDIAVGMIVFTALAIFVCWITSIGLIIPAPIITWLNDSPNPQFALYSFGALTSGLILALARFGMVIPQLKAYIPEQAIKYVAGLPLWFVGLTIIASSIALFLVFPTCRTPGTVIFSVTGRGDLRPGDALIVPTDDTLTITARAIEESERLHCQWQYAGNAFQSLGNLSGCDIKIGFSSKPGDGFLTLLASYGFCTQSAVFSIPVTVQTR